jgi:transforming growth factor-beta-induced protein
MVGSRKCRQRCLRDRLRTPQELKRESAATAGLTCSMCVVRTCECSFGRLVANAPKLTPARVESIGVTLADKNAGPFKLEVDFIRELSRPGGAPVVSPSLASVAKGAGLTTLLSLVQASGLQLPADDRLTVFAPANEAFAALPAEKVQYLTSDQGKPTLRAILKNHMLPMAIDSGSLLQLRSVVALSGQSLAVDSEALTIAGAKLLTADVAFDRGIVHVIDRIMMPETRSIADIVSEDPRLTILLKAVTAAGLVRQLGGENEGPWTLLTPSNEAFAALGEERIKALMADSSQLVNVLSAHVIPSRIRRTEVIAQGSARTLLGRDAVSFAIVNGGVTAGGSGIIAADIEASNGIIHIIDRMIIPNPATSESTSAARVKASPASVSGLVELAIERGVPIFNDGKPEACAAIYEVTIAALVDLAPEALGNDAVERLRLALAEGEAEKGARKRAWIFRRTMDRVYQDVSRHGSN